MQLDLLTADNEYSRLYNQKVLEGMAGINAIDDIEARYQHFRETLPESAQEVLPEVERTARQKWMTAPILQKMEQRRLAKGNVALYNLLDREIRQDCRTAKEAMLIEQCQVIKQLDAAHKSKLMHSQIKLVIGRTRGNNTTTCIEDKNRDIIMEKDEILSRWSEYIAELYNDDNRGDMPENAAEVESPITRREVEHALRGMPEKKLPGPDGINTEMLVAAGEVVILVLTELSNMIHYQGSFPSELNKSIFITLPNVNGTIKCEKYRTINWMSHLTKLVLRIVINRIRGGTIDEIAPVQYGFMPDKGTGNSIFVLQRLVERSVEKQGDVYTSFIDYSKAFDTVKHESLVELLQSLDVDKLETTLLTHFYWKQTADVRCGDDISEWLDIKQGVRQGCVASPHLFALYTEMIMRGLDDMDGFRIGGTVVNNLRYADDAVIIAESEEQLQRLINVVVTKSEEKGMYLNSAKSFAMVFSKASQIPTYNINVLRKILE